MRDTEHNRYLPQADDKVTWLHRLRMLPSYARRNSKFALGIVVVCAVVLMAIFAPVLAPHDPTKINLGSRLMPPTNVAEQGTPYLLGTDQLGRDLLSRIIYGARVSLIVGLFSVITSGAVGSLLGLLSGYYGGWVDTIIMRVTDIQMALPFILLALLIVALLGPSFQNLVIVFTITAWYGYARLARAASLSIRERDWVLAARTLGATDLHILWRHLVPNLLSPLLVFGSLEMARIIITEAALGFLGLGVPPPTPTWGNMISDGREYVQDAWWIATFPGLVLMVTVLGINLFGDGLRDAMDPSLRK